MENIEGASHPRASFCSLFPTVFFSVFTFSHGLVASVLLHSESTQAPSSYQVFKSSNLHLNKSQSLHTCKQSTRNPMLIMMSSIYYTSVAMMHSFFSSAITKTDWYIESLEEHIVDILHSGLSLYILLKCLLSSIIFSQFSSLSRRDSSSLYPAEVL